MKLARLRAIRSLFVWSWGLELDWGWSQLMVMSRYQESDTRSVYNVVLYTFKWLLILKFIMKVIKDLQVWNWKYSKYIHNWQHFLFKSQTGANFSSPTCPNILSGSRSWQRNGGGRVSPGTRPVIEDGQLAAVFSRGGLANWRITAGNVPEVDHHHPQPLMFLTHHHLGILVPGAVEKAGCKNPLNPVSMKRGQ